MHFDECEWTMEDEIDESWLRPEDEQEIHLQQKRLDLGVWLPMDKQEKLEMLQQQFLISHFVAD